MKQGRLLRLPRHHDRAPAITLDRKLLDVIDASSEPSQGYLGVSDLPGFDRYAFAAVRTPDLPSVLTTIKLRRIERDIPHADDFALVPYFSNQPTSRFLLELLRGQAPYQDAVYVDHNEHERSPPVVRGFRVFENRDDPQHFDVSIASREYVPAPLIEEARPLEPAFYKLFRDE